MAVGGCGGGGSSGSGSSANTITQPSHTAPNLSFNDTNSAEISAQTVAVVTSLRTLGYALVFDLESVSPESPVRQMPCGGGGSFSITYVDTDKSGSRSAGDKIVISAPGCSVTYFGNGTATATVLEAIENDLVDVRIVVDGGTLPYLEAWNWVPNLKGTLRMTANDDKLWLRSEGDVVFSAGNTHSYRVFNLGFQLHDDITNNPPAPGVMGGLDIAFNTPTGGGASISVDTSGIFSGHSENVAPSPGPLWLKGRDRSVVRIVDAGTTNPGWFLIATDKNGDGVEENTSTISYRDIFNNL